MFHSKLQLLYCDTNRNLYTFLGDFNNASATWEEFAPSKAKAFQMARDTYKKLSDFRGDK